MSKQIETLKDGSTTIRLLDDSIIIEDTIEGDTYVEFVSEEWAKKAWDDIKQQHEKKETSLDNYPLTLAQIVFNVCTNIIYERHMKKWL
ncbi:MAG: hypothetical protein ACOC56_02905 [Atribacterota bacterium]